MHSGRSLQMMFFRKKPQMAGTIAAVDLGSNSFHLLIAQQHDNSIRIVDHLKDSVGLSADLNATGQISEAARERALACLEKFGQRVQDIPRGWVNAVGTNTFRKAGNADAFLKEAEAALGHPIDVISGAEEARLIYLGVTHGLEGDDQCRAVFDIGGSSSELIYGIGTTPRQLESFDVGCVTLSSKIFASGELSAKKFRRAKVFAQSELDYWRQNYPDLKYDIVTGTSGTIRTIDRLLAEQGLSKEGITGEALDQLQEMLLSLGSTQQVAKTLKVDKYRARNLPGGLAILRALFSTLDIGHMVVSDKAMRQGLIYDMTGSKSHDNIRLQSIERMMEKYSVDRPHTRRIMSTIDGLFEKTATPWGLESSDIRNFLSWAAMTHEIGLYISHSQYHKHGAYLLENTDLLGFTRQEQQILALLVRCHRKKLPPQLFTGFSAESLETLNHAIAILRIAILLNRTRGDDFLPSFQVEADFDSIRLAFPADWLAGHPLTLTDLEYEARVLKDKNIDLIFS